MSRAVVLALVLLPFTSIAAPVPKSLKPKYPVGEWRVEFKNGVVEACSVGGDGKSKVVEPLRTADGRSVVSSGGVVVIAFADDRTERWTPDGDRYAVEHWCPSASYPNAPPVRGVAERAKP